MRRAGIIPRFAAAEMREALRDTPVVLLHGPRQSGKSTLARQIGEERGHKWFSFDDDTVRAAAEADPQGFVAELPDRVILDEIQRVPRIFTSLKLSVDRRRIPGRYLLTGSANILLLPSVTDSLAGRMEVIRLFPMSQREMAWVPPGFLPNLFRGDLPTEPAERLGIKLAERLVSGGYPAALERSSPRRRQRWYRNYVETLVHRDVQDLRRISSLDALPRLLTMVAGQTAHLLNVTELSAPFQMSRPTVREYITLLTHVFIVEELPPWHGNRLRRLVKSPKIHIGDTGLGAALLGLDAEALHHDRSLMGQMLETFVLQELRREASGLEPEHRFFHYRDRDQVEVDIVIERDGRLVAGIEVKASSTVGSDDFRGLRKLAGALGDRFAAGVVLYDGEHCVTFGDRLHALPISSLWADF